MTSLCFLMGSFDDAENFPAATEAFYCQIFSNRCGIPCKPRAKNTVNFLSKDLLMIQFYFLGSSPFSSDSSDSDPSLSKPSWSNHDPLSDNARFIALSFPKGF